MNKAVRIVYDKQCPVCHQYCVLAKKHAEQETELIDARETSELMAEITRQGLDIDEGMVVEVDGVLYYGAEAIHVLGSRGPRRGAFNALNRLLFKNVNMARFLYPLLRSCRNLLLKVLRVNRINNLGVDGKDRF